ncbi:hypothetical protein A2U01_0086436, partial [Trifolium medium]|nr:hypothetical protein [Trifolium medium]
NPVNSVLRLAWNSPRWAHQPAGIRKNRAAFCAWLGPSRAGRNRQQSPRKNRTQSAPGLVHPVTP